MEHKNRIFFIDNDFCFSLKPYNRLVGIRDEIVTLCFTPVYPIWQSVTG